MIVFFFLSIGGEQGGQEEEEKVSDVHGLSGVCVAGRSIRDIRGPDLSKKPHFAQFVSQVCFPFYYNR